MKNIFLLLAIMTWSACACAAADGYLPIFNQANDLYAKGHYEKAAGLYEDLVSKGQANAALYYNLGNAYFKTQKYGRAVLSFERAARLKPRDPDIRFNLAFLRAMVKEPGEPFPEIIVTSLDNLISLNELTVLSSVSFFLLISGLILYMALKQRGMIVFNAVCAAAVILCAGWLFVKIDLETLSREAIVTAGPADVRNGPGAENSVGFSLPEGRKVMVLGGKDDWAAIGLKSEGLKGWIEKKYLEEI